MIEAKNTKNNLLFILVLFICISIPIGIRLIELPKWQKPSLEIDGEKLMATHDAYFFLASAIKTSQRPDEPLGLIVRTMSKITNIPPAKIGFFVPAIFSPLLVIPIVFLAREEEMIEAAFATSILGACCLGYLGRSRLGFLDTDFGMGLLVALCATITIWLSKDKKLEDYLNIETNIPPFLMGLIGAVYMWFYGSGRPLVLFSLFIAFISSIVVNKQKKKPLFAHFPGLILMFVCCFNVVVGLCTLIAITIYLYFAKKREVKIYFLILIVAAIATTVISSVYMVIYSGILQILTYTKIVPHSITAEKNASISLPSVAQSVKEVQNLKFSAAVIRIAQNWPTFIAGIIGILYLFLKRPSYWVFVIFPLLGIASIKLGNRFTMYGGVGIGMGIGFGIGLFLKELLPKTGRWLSQLAIGVLVLIPIVQIAIRFFPVPVLPKVYAKTFKEVSKISPKNSRLWQWWDYGYACQYYANRPSFGDGGAHDGPYLYPLAVVHTSPSPRQASQLMKFITYSQMEEYKQHPEKYKHIPDMWKIYAPNPVKKLSEMGAENSSIFLDALKKRPLFSLLQNSPLKIKELNKLPPQYMVVSWENLKLAYWITYYGTWDIVTSQAFPGRIQSVRGNVSLNLKDGFVIINGQKIQLDGFIIIDNNVRAKTLSWVHGTDLFGIYNSLSKEFYLMDGTIFYSNMIQMLLGPPSKFKPYFRLVIDHFPWTRVYVTN